MSEFSFIHPLIFLPVLVVAAAEWNPSSTESIYPEVVTVVEALEYYLL
jgi:hypothetical protein